jgi:signal transduction histidine kinase/ligand-binding sensor domain-containing protein
LLLMILLILALSSSAQNQPPVALPSPTPTPSPSPSPSPTPPPNLHQWGAVTSFHGLPSDRTHAIAQTEFGITWFATDGGLARYDGRRTNSISAEGMPAGRVLALQAGEAGSLWVGTDNGAARLANARFELIKETAGKVITAIIRPKPDRIIMASESGVIFDCQVKPDQSVAVRMIPDQPLESADVDHPGPLKITGLALIGETIYAGTQSRGLLMIENGEVKEVGGKPRAFFINAVETDGQGHLWAGARARGDEGGLLDLREPLKPTKAKGATGSVTAIARGAHDDIWVATDNRGAFHFLNGKLTEHFTFEETGGALRSDHIFGVFVDAEEVVWFATDKGVCRYDPHATRTENISNDAATNYVRALWRTSLGQVIAGTNSGLFVYQPDNKKWLNLPELGRRIIYAIHDDNNGRVLVATASGLFGSPADHLNFQRIGTDEKLPQGDSVRAITNAAGATYVATFGYGVEKLEGTKRSLVWPTGNADEHLREVVSLNADGGGRLLIGTASAGLYFFDGKQTSTEPALEPLKNESIWSAVPDGNGFWLATGRGLYFYQAPQLKEIAGNTSARSIFPVNGRAGEIWCATVSSGLLRVSLDEQFGGIVSRLDVEQGLPSQRVFAVLTEKTAAGDDSVIAGTNRGIVRYEPGRVAPTVLPARIISQRIHQPAELSAGLQLDYPQNSLLLDVTAISSRTFPEQFQYAFALYDSGGKVIREKLSRDSQFAMEGLRPGNYRVVARAFTKDLVPATPLKFEFKVGGAPFPWTTTALAVLLLLALIALTWAAIEHRRIVTTSGALAAANRELAGARLQLANETEAERRRIARDLHDQTLADLRNLMLSVDQLPAANTGRQSPVASDHAVVGSESYDPIKLRAEIESISQEVRRICEDLSPSVLQNVGFAAALEFALNHAVEHAPPDCKFTYDFVCDESFDERLALPASVQIQIYRIAQEALSNICRHAGANHVRMSISAAHDGALALEIEDDGRGFDARAIKKKPGRGVANIRARASMIDAEVAWVQRDGGGTVFRLLRRTSGQD